ncbi:hypothetical protein L5G28_07730 [Gordonia sp. HY285]|uniref:hypothetical protein n=1 Tax=Gordonia liuliyuniae TaxID=2911517 RepID=UPI001F2998D0|nr:hypothetical protein [Gordonia liuliyuniae]MCF8610051.1 hypothetical protein [Gordonia liuliyuniae]
MTAATDDVLLACDLAVRMTLEAAGRSIRNKRGRASRGAYRGVADSDLYLVLTPAPAAHEVDQFETSFSRWWGLPSVLDEAAIPHIQLIMRACHEYVRQLVLAQAPHDVAALRAYLDQVDAVAVG